MDDTTEEIPTHKVCSVCGEDKPLSDFSTRKDCKYGVHSQCRLCVAIRGKASRNGEITHATECEDCGGDITHRGPTARLCEPCGKERNRASALKYYAADPNGVRQRISETWHALPKEEKLARSRLQALKKFGLTPESYAAMLEAQGGVCKICKRPETHEYQGVVVQMCVDHDHSCCPGKWTCGKCVRGLLCHDCNAGLGYFEDSIQAMLTAVEYLETWQLQKTGRLSDDH